MTVICGGTTLYSFCINKGRTNDYILHLRVRNKGYIGSYKEEKQYAFNREPGESFSQLRERARKIAGAFCFSGEYPKMKVYRTRKNFSA